MQRVLTRKVIWVAKKFSSNPDRNRIFNSLTELYNAILTDKGKKGTVLDMDETHQRIVILSDQHKGAKNDADDFAFAEKNYLAALDYYYGHGFYYINLGDGEELWENNIAQVKKYNKPSFEKEKLFLQQRRFTKIFGNHDLYWDNDPLASFNLQSIYGQKVSICDGIVLTTQVNGKQLH